MRASDWVCLGAIVLSVLLLLYEAHKGRLKKLRREDLYQGDTMKTRRRREKMRGNRPE